MAETNGYKVKEAEAKPVNGSLSPDEEQRPLRAETPPVFDARKRRRCGRRCCCFSCLAAVIILAIIILVLALTVFKTKDPKITVNNIIIDDLSTSVDPPTMRVHVNLTLIAGMSLKNPNKAASFKHGSSNTVIFYRGNTVGQAVIPAGKIKADRTVKMNVSVTVFVDALTSSASNLVGDGIAGSLAMTTRTEMAGRVNLLHIIKKHVKVSAYCNINVLLSARTAEVQHCSESFKI